MSIWSMSTVAAIAPNDDAIARETGGDKPNEIWRGCRAWNRRRPMAATRKSGRRRWYALHTPRATRSQSWRSTATSQASESRFKVTKRATWDGKEWTNTSPPIKLCLSVHGDVQQSSVRGTPSSNGNVPRASKKYY